MSSAQVVEYVATLEEPKRGTLQTLRRTILELRLRGQTIAGFAAFKSHVSHLPFSGSVLGQLGSELEATR
jgi:hypothetical protein